MINTIIRNLLNNAIKYTPKGGLVKVEVLKNDLYASIAVIDTGIGIPKDRIEKLLTTKDTFTTLGTDKESGTGLGLMITKDFIKLNKGSFDIESNEDHGTTFRFTLPLA
jgi:signal transduction histidine kinase